MGLTSNTYFAFFLLTQMTAEMTAINNMITIRSTARAPPAAPPATAAMETSSETSGTVVVPGTPVGIQLQVLNEHLIEVYSVLGVGAAWMTHCTTVSEDKVLSLRDVPEILCDWELRELTIVVLRNTVGVSVVTGAVVEDTSDVISMLEEVNSSKGRGSLEDGMLVRIEVADVVTDGRIVVLLGHSVQLTTHSK